MKESFEKQPYKGSPLESIFTNILNKIKKLKEKYPSTASRSFEQIQAIEKIVNVFNEKILPRFDNKTPDFIDMGLIGLEIYGFDEKLGETFYSLATPKALFFGHAMSVFSEMVWSFIKKGKSLESLTNKKIADKLDLSQTKFVLETKKLLNQSLHVETLNDEFKEVIQSLLGLKIGNFHADMLKDVNIILPLFLNLVSQLFTNTKKTAAFTIDNPMFFELVVYLTELIDQAPKELQQIIPFFKPETIIELADERILGKNISISHEKNLKYNITLGVAGELSINLSDLYAISYPTFKEIMFSAIASYMMQHPNDLLVTKEMTQSQLLHTYVQNESKLIQKKVKLHTENCILASNDNLQGLALVRKIDEQIKYNLSLSIDNGLLQKELTNQLQDFHPNVLKYSDKDSNKGLINPCLTKKMPSNVVGWDEENNAFAVISIKEKLDSVINEQINRLKQGAPLLEKRAEELKFSRQQALEQWKQCEQQKQLQYLEDLLFKQQDLLENYNKESIPVSVNPEADQQNTLDGDIKWIEQRILALKSLTIGLSDCLNQARQSSKLPQESILYDHSRSLQNTLTEEFKLFEPKINSLSESIAIANEQLYKQLRQKEQDKFEAVRKECLNSEDLGKIQQALSKYTGEQFVLKKNADDLGGRLKSIESQINENATPLEKLISLQNEQKKEWDQCVDVTQKSIVNAFKTIREHWPSYYPQNAQILKKDFNACMEWIQKSYRFIETTLKLENKDNLQDAQSCLDRVAIYVDMQNTLNNALTNSLPFAELDTLVLNKLFDDNVSQITGFENVLQCLGLQEHKLKFIDYRHRQEAFWRMAPTHDERKYLFDLLTDKIKLKSKEQKQHYRMAMLCEAFALVEKNLKETSSKKSDFDLSQLKYDALDKGIQILKSEQMELVKQLSELNAQCDVLEGTKYVLQSKIILLDGINLQDSALSVLNQKKDFLELNPLIFEMQDMQAQLVNKVNQLGMSADVSTFRVRVESIEHNMRLMIENQFDAKKLHEGLATNIKWFDELNEKSLEHIDLSNLFEEYTQLSESMEAFHRLFIDIGNIVKKMNNLHCTNEMASINKRKVDLQQKMQELGCSVLDYFDKQLTVQLTKANVFQSLEFPEQCEQSLLNATVLSDVTNYLKQFAGIDQFNKTLALYSKDVSLIKQFTDTMGKVDTQLSDSIVLNEDLARRIENRKELVEIWSNTFDDILTIHNGQYDEFINELKLQMTAFKDSGRSIEVYNSICDKQKLIPKGYQLQRVLNQLKLALVDSDRQIPSTYHVVEPTNYSALAEQLLRDHADKPYVEKMRHVQTQIRVLAEFGATLSHESDKQHIAALVEKLTEDLDYFIVQQGGVAPSTESHQQFADLFLARLHSKDDELNERRDTWDLVFQILANIAIGVATLGVAIGIKLIHSKVTTDKFSFFCDKTNRVEQIDEAGELIQQTLVPSP